MLDKRIALSDGYELSLNIGENYVIEKEVGRGSSCIVYDASYKDNLGLAHNMRIKECYPYYLEMKRMPGGKLVVSDKEVGSFKEAQEKFSDAYRRNIDIKNTLGLINSTVNTTNIYHKNDTTYTVMNYDEGKEYSHNIDADLQSMFVRVKAVADVIKKYHSKGFLYLDIKPENIMVIPETKEHVMLFDFDSLIATEELKNNDSLHISFSDGFAAPEQVQGKKDKISEATDIFSIGALLFYKVFGKKPGIMDCTIGSKFDYSKIVCADNRYQPALFKKLDEFLHKTLSTSVTCRWKCIDKVLDILDELIKLADVESVFLYDNFAYNANYFVGRTRELEEIREVIFENQVLFIHGIGGIGKTEVAKRFVYENRKHFNTVVFLSFRDSIVETVTGTDIKIENFYGEIEESDEDFFKRKIDVLKSVLSQNDLIILDNFDVSNDDYLETLLECPCKFLITTREDFRDYNYPQKDIYEMKNIEDLIDLFRAYNSNEYDESEMECITEIINLVDRHTMTVELIAKYLRDIMETAIELRDKLRENLGITGTDNLDVKHRKDKRLRSESINKHLLILFDLSGFSDSEYELIKSLSLLGYVRIIKSKFLEYFSYEDTQKDLVSLIHKGWIEYDEAANKISLHQVIVDLVYNHLKPTSESCPALTMAMKDYACMEMENYTDRNIRKKLLDLFVKRIVGSDDNLASFYLAYCINVRNEERLLNKIEAICTVDEGQCHCDLMKDVCIQRIKILSSNNDCLMFEEDTNEYFHKFALEVSALAEKSNYYLKELSIDDNEKVRFYVKLAGLVDTTASGIEMYVFGEEGECLDIMYTKARDIFEKAAVLLEVNKMNSEEKISMYKKLLEFYKDTDYCAMYRSNHYADSEKALYYTKKIAQERTDETVIYIEPNTIAYKDCGDNASFRGEHGKSIEYYLKALEEDEQEAEWVLPNIAKEYEAIGEYNKALECLITTLEIDKKEQLNICYICEPIINLLIKKNDIKGAITYCDMAINCLDQKVNVKGNEEDYKDDIEWLIVFYAKKYTIVDFKEKETCFEKSMKYYHQYRTINKQICDFLEIVCKKKLETENVFIAAKQILDIAEQYSEDYEYDSAKRIVNLLLDEDGRILLKENANMLIEALCCMCEILEYESDYQSALKHSLEAKNELTNLSDEYKDYLYNLVLKHMGECYYGLSDYEKGKAEKNKCNYYLLAEQLSKGKALKEQIEVWQEAAEAYSNINKYADTERCYQKLFKIWEPVLNVYEYSSFENYWNQFLGRLRSLLEQELFDLVFKYNTETYLKAVDFYQSKMISIKNADDKEREINVFCWRMNEIAYNYEKSTYNYQAIVMYMIRVIVAVEEKMNGIDLKSVICFDETVERVVSTNMTKLLKQENISKESVDMVIETFEKIIYLNNNYSWLNKVIGQYHSFTNVYQYQDVDFKR